MGWVNELGNSVLGPGQAERWWWWWSQEPEGFVIQPLPHNAGGVLHLEDHSVERNLDGTTTYHVAIRNEGPQSVEYNLLGVFLTQPG